jgi:ferredoxin
MRAHHTACTCEHMLAYSNVDIDPELSNRWLSAYQMCLTVGGPSSFTSLVAIMNQPSFAMRARTMWSNTISRISVGLYSPCETQSDSIDLIFSGQCEDQIRRIIRLLPIMTDDYSVTGSKLRIAVKDMDRRRLNILVEIAINCKACGACTSLCVTGGLKVDKESVYVDFTKCNKCQNCLRTHPLRGACVIRNYSHKVASLVKS